VIHVERIGPRQWLVTRPDGSRSAIGYAAAGSAEIDALADELEAKAAANLKHAKDARAIAAHEQVCEANIAALRAVEKADARTRAAETRRQRKDPFGFGEQPHK
jgi:hypothetical protein